MEPPDAACDVCVVGLGAMGLASALSCARAGQRVVGLDGRASPDDPTNSASAGATRAWRLAYSEPIYAAMMAAALPLWRRLEEDSGQQLLRTTGGLDFSTPDTGSSSTTYTTALDDIAATNAACGESFRWVDAAAVKKDICHMLQLPAGARAVHSQTYGVIQAAAALTAMANQAQSLGAVLHFGQHVSRLELVIPSSCSSPSYWLVHTDQGLRIRTRHVVLATGGWPGVNPLLAAALPTAAPPPLPVSIVELETPHFRDRSGRLDPRTMPVCAEYGRKAEVCDAYFLQSSQADGEPLIKLGLAEDAAGHELEYLQRLFPEADFEEAGRERCWNACTPNSRPFVDVLVPPQAGGEDPARLVLALGFSHNFKHCVFVGEVVRALAAMGAAAFSTPGEAFGADIDLSPLRIGHRLDTAKSKT